VGRADRGRDTKRDGGGPPAAPRYLNPLGAPPCDRHGLEYQYGIGYLPRAAGRDSAPRARWPRWLLAGSALFAAAVLLGSLIASRTAPRSPHRYRLSAPTGATMPGAGLGARPGPDGPASVTGLTGDAIVTGCASAVGAPATARIVLTNHGPDPADYLVTIVLAAGNGTVLGQVDVVAHGLAPGQSTVPRQISVGRAVPAGGLICRAGALTRHPTNLV
jgi:hypothetical protein